MFTKKELEIIYKSLIRTLQSSKQEFEETKDLDLANKIYKINELIKKIEIMYEE